MSNDTFALPLVLFHGTKWYSPFVLSISDGDKKWRLGVKIDHKLRTCVTECEDSVVEMEFFRDCWTSFG
ncbi:MAG TPA: hypothetical protein DD739_20095 [Ochrobactrum anthropi]|nr:hypothetical protein [Brucella anthropi]